MGCPVDRDMAMGCPVDCAHRICHHYPAKGCTSVSKFWRYPSCLPMHRQTLTGADELHISLSSHHTNIPSLLGEDLRVAWISPSLPTSVAAPLCSSSLGARASNYRVPGTCTTLLYCSTVYLHFSSSTVVLEYSEYFIQYNYSVFTG
jgi:hypothetical protein